MGSPIIKKNVSSWVADGAIAANVAVVSDAAGKVKTGAGANDANGQGVSLAAADDGGHVDVAGIGSIVWCKAGAAISTYGKALIIGDSSGRVIECPFAATTTYNIFGYARGTCSNANEQIPVLVMPHLHYNHS